MHPQQLSGILGWAESVITALGEWGVGLLVALETVFPPVPSEVVLPLAGFLAQRGELSLWLVLMTATLGSYLGAFTLYGLGALLGTERSIRGLSKLPLVDREDFGKAAKWFERHGKASIFFGRLIPGVRSLISLPAGAERMNLATFSLFTVAGSALWNALLIGPGAALGHAVRTGRPVLQIPQLRRVGRRGRLNRVAGRASGAEAARRRAIAAVPERLPHRSLSGLEGNF